jgi:hypothetical protein
LGAIGDLGDGNALVDGAIGEGPTRQQAGELTVEAQFVLLRPEGQPVRPEPVWAPPCGSYDDHRPLGNLIQAEGLEFEARNDFSKQPMAEQPLDVVDSRRRPSRRLPPWPRPLGLEQPRVAAKSGKPYLSDPPDSNSELWER